MRQSLRALILIALATLISACGFQPLYAPQGADGTISLRNINLAGVSGSAAAAPLVEEVFDQRGAEPGDADYDLFIDVDESAARLAVQLDTTVTRFNYQLRGRYTLVERKSGRKTTGSALAVSSFNIVESQFATLYAENAAREKAAVSLAEQIERKILIRISEKAAAETRNGEEEADLPEFIEPELESYDENILRVPEEAF